VHETARRPRMITSMSLPIVLIWLFLA